MSESDTSFVARVAEVAALMRGGRAGAKAETAVRRPPRWTLGRKLMYLIGALITLALAILIVVQVRQLSVIAYSDSETSSLHLSKLLAAQSAGGLRWNRPSSIERAYRSLTLDPETRLASVVAFDRDERTLLTYQSPHFSVFDLEAAFAAAKPQLDSGEMYRLWSAQHLVYFFPIIAGARDERVGTLALAWSLEPIHERVTQELWSQTGLGLAVTIGLLIVFVSLLHRVAGRPLAEITETTRQLADGHTHVAVPHTERGDEIGELARSLKVFRQNLEIIDRLSQEQRAQTRRLASALEKERHFNTLQGDFVAMVSHEFRTPLSIIDGAAQRIQRHAGGSAEPEIADKTKRIRTAVVRMIALIESVLGSASLESGMFRPQVTQCDLRRIVAQVCQRQQELSPDHRISVDIEGLPKNISGDPNLLNSVFTNLVTNAVKYSPQNPQIEVIGRSEGAEAVISITDHGVGIPLHEQDRVFERYFRASTASGIAGTGIGLAFCSQALELQGGRIELSSAEGAGTRFTVRLPLRRSAASNEQTLAEMLEAAEGTAAQPTAAAAT